MSKLFRKLRQRLGPHNSNINNNNTNISNTTITTATNATNVSTTHTHTHHSHHHHRHQTARFFQAIRDGNVKRVQTMLQANQVDANVTDPEQERSRPPLLTAARKGHAIMVDLLLQHGAAIDVLSASAGESALHIAAWNGYTAVVQVLLRNGVNVHVVNKKGQTALHHAVCRGRVAIVRLLLTAGANEMARDHLYETPLDVLRQRPKSSKARQDMEKLLFEQGDRHASLRNQSLLTLFFTAADYQNVSAWLDKMADSVAHVHECRIFYTIIRAAAQLQVIPMAAAQQWAAKVLGQTALRSKSEVSLNLLFLIVSKAHRDQMINEELYTKLNDYRKAKERSGEKTLNTTISPDIRWTIKQAAARVNGLEGTPEAVGVSLRFLFARMDLLRQKAAKRVDVETEIQAIEQQEQEALSTGKSTDSGDFDYHNKADDDDDAPLSQRFRKMKLKARASRTSFSTTGNNSLAAQTLATNKSDLSERSSGLAGAVHKARIESMVGFLGVVLNSILMGVEMYGASLNHLLQFIVDFGDPVHIQKIIATEFEYDKAAALRKHVGYGVNVARRVAQLKAVRSDGGGSVVQQAEEYLQVVIGRKDPLVNLGFCTVLLDAAKKIESGAGSFDDEEDNWDVLSKLSSDLEILSTVSPLPSIGSADYNRTPQPQRRQPGKENGINLRTGLR